MALQRTEFELKFVGAAPDVAAAPGLSWLDEFAASPGVWERVASTYYDSTDGRLARAGLSLRIRDDGDGRTLTVKSAAGGSSVKRMECERALADGETSFVTGVAEVDAMIGSDEDLVPVARTTTDRWHRFLERRGTLIEMSAETGVAERLVAPVAPSPLAEIELELLKGDAAALFDIADRLNTSFDGRLRLSVEAKRDKALRAGRHRMPRVKERRALSGDAVAGDVLSAALKQCAADIVELSMVVVESHDGEAARRLRVALRRLRAAEKAFRPLLEDRPLKKLAAQARDLARVVGAVRDLDLFVVDSLPLAPAGPLRAKLEAERARLSNVAARALSGADFGAFAIDLMRAAWLEDWRRNGRKGLAGPAREYADGMLRRCFSKLAASAATADFDEPRTLHPLRIELKKFRYAAQFFRDCHDGAVRKQSFAAMSALQDALGAVNDAVTAVSIADQAATGGGAVIARAAGFIAGCRGIEARERAAAARSAWAALAAAPAYWRPANDPSTDAP